MNKGKIEIILFILLAVCGIAYGYYRYVLHAQIVSINDMNKEVKTNQVALVKLRNIKENKKATETSIAKYENEATVLDKAVPDGNDNYGFNMQLYSTIKAYGLVIKVLEPQIPSSNKGYIIQNVNIGITGPKNNVLNFIKYLDENPRRVQIKEINVRDINVQEMDANIKIAIFSVI